MIITFEQLPQDKRLGTSLFDSCRVVSYSGPTVEVEPYFNALKGKRLQYDVRKDIPLVVSNQQGQMEYFLRVLNPNADYSAIEEFIEVVNPKSRRNLHNARFRLWWHVESNTFFTFNRYLSQNLANMLAESEFPKPSNAA